ncbi:hypothetical protein SH661x_000922 [Planctomicrobium sp. SH661]|uniref:hypothetical protein n=1 Tax=Planctomicrobium sp. SH661 TaxID=3448124 RepID=UPI003F5B7797
MPSGPDSLAEVRRLAYAMFDGVIDAAGVERLECLILDDPACLQTYVEMVNLHGDLFSKADLKTDREAVLAVLRDFTQACERREKNRRRALITALAASVLVVGSAVGWMFLGNTDFATPVGRLAHMTSNAVSNQRKMELGQIIRKGKTISVKEGVVSFQLEDVLLDLIGPVELKLESSKVVHLKSGTLAAYVLPGGEGFTVRTPDAEVVDQGTEFCVRYDPVRGTDVAVRRGRAVASLLNSQGASTMEVDLTSSRSAHLNLTRSLLEETIYEPQQFEPIDRTRGTIRSMTGQLRTLVDPPASLLSEETPTPNHMLVIQERQNVKLDRDLTVEGVTGRAVIPAGTTVSSYLVHYDPTVQAIYSPRGTIKFFGKIGAAISSADALNATDEQFGLSETTYEKRTSRGLEAGADEVRISEAGEAVSFFFGMSPPEYLDQVRVLVIAGK